MGLVLIPPGEETGIREVAQSHTAETWWSWALNPGSLTLQFMGHGLRESPALRVLQSYGGGGPPARSRPVDIAGAVPWQGWRQGGSQKRDAGDSESTASSLLGSWPGGGMGRSWEPV